MRNADPTRMAAVLGALALAGCAGTGAGYVPSGDLGAPGAPGAAGERAAVGHERGSPVGAGGRGFATEAHGAETRRVAAPGSAGPASADLRSGGSGRSAAAPDTRAPEGKREDTRVPAAARERATSGSDGQAPSSARVAGGASPPAPEATASGVARSGTSASAPAAAAPSTDAAREEDGGGVGVWLLGLLLAGAVAGGGWFALQPKWVRRRVLRGIRAAPGRVLARLRRGRAGGATSTSTWSTPGSAWIASGRGDRGGSARSEGMGPRGRATRRPKSITNATLPAIRIPVAGDADVTHD